MKSRVQHLVLLLSLVVAASESAAAKIIYTPMNVTVSGSGFLKIDLNHNGITDVSIVLSGHTFFCAMPAGLTGSTGSIYALPASRAGTVANGNYVLALTGGANIGPGRYFYSPEGVMWRYSTCGIPSGFSTGAWQNVSNRYLGIKFLINGYRHYGWARLTVTRTKYGPVVTLTGYAYETDAGRSILAGATS